MVVRRALLTPPTLLLELIGVPVLALLLVIVTPVSFLLDRSLRAPRAMVVGITYLALDVWAFTACVVATLSAAVRMHDREARAERAFVIGDSLLHRLYRVAQRVLDLDVHIDGSGEALAAVSAAQRPLIVLSRHAGPGDTFLIIHELLRRRRRPRVVVRAALQADPGIDVLGSMLSFCFVRRGAGQSEHTLARITRLAAGMGWRDALLLFPEGGNVSRARVRRGIERLLRQGLLRQARRAARLHHLAPPHVGGVLAALRGCGDADVIFVAHTGLAGMNGPVWRWIPVHCTLRMHLFRVVAGEVPDSDASRTRWLFDWWQRLDAWVDRARAE